MNSSNTLALGSRRDHGLHQSIGDNPPPAATACPPFDSGDIDEDVDWGQFLSAEALGEIPAPKSLHSNVEIGSGTEEPTILPAIPPTHSTSLPLPHNPVSSRNERGGPYPSTNVTNACHRIDVSLAEVDKTKFEMGEVLQSTNGPRLGEDSDSLPQRSMMSMNREEQPHCTDTSEAYGGINAHQPLPLNGFRPTETGPTHNDMPNAAHPHFEFPENQSLPPCPRPVTLGGIDVCHPLPLNGIQCVETGLINSNMPTAAHAHSTQSTNYDQIPLLSSILTESFVAAQPRRNADPFSGMPVVNMPPAMPRTAQLQNIMQYRNASQLQHFTHQRPMRVQRHVFRRNSLQGLNHNTGGAPLSPMPPALNPPFMGQSCSASDMNAILLALAAQGRTINRLPQFASNDQSNMVRTQAPSYPIQVPVGYIPGRNLAPQPFTFIHPIQQRQMVPLPRRAQYMNSQHGFHGQAVDSSQVPALLATTPTSTSVPHMIPEWLQYFSQTNPATAMSHGLENHRLQNTYQMGGLGHQAGHVRVQNQQPQYDAQLGYQTSVSLAQHQQHQGQVQTGSGHNHPTNSMQSTPLASSSRPSLVSAVPQNTGHIEPMQHMGAPEAMAVENQPPRVADVDGPEATKCPFTGCTDILPRNKDKILTHIRAYHITAGIKTPVLCPYPICIGKEQMHLENLGRHINSVHFKTRVYCSGCRGSWMRQDSAKRHRCSLNNNPANKRQRTA